MGDRQRLQAALVGAAIAIAIVVGAYAAKRLIESGAAVRQTASARYGVLQAQARAHPRPKKVPFLGPFAHNRRGIQECGPAVRLMEGALRHTTPPVRKAPPTKCVGRATTLQIKAFQKRHHYRQTGVYNLPTHNALAHAYTRKQRNDLIYIAHLQLLRKQRRTVLIVTSHAQLVGGHMGYTQSGSRAYFSYWPNVPPNTDCSGFVTWVLYQSGVGARAGYYGPGSAVGWTGTLGRQGRLVRGNGPLKVGDLIFYGGGFPYGHVEIYIGHGRTVGHGSPGVHNHPYNYRAVAAVRRFIFRIRRKVLRHANQEENDE